MHTPLPQKLKPHLVPIDVAALDRNELDSKLPFGMLCELWFFGRWSNDGRGDNYIGPRFMADAITEKWIDLDTGGSGVGSIALGSYVLKINEDEAEQRMRLWAEIAAPQATPDGDTIWNLSLERERRQSAPNKVGCARHG